MTESSTSSPLTVNAMCPRLPASFLLLGCRRRGNGAGEPERLQFRARRWGHAITRVLRQQAAKLLSAVVPPAELYQRAPLHQHRVGNPGCGSIGVTLDQGVEILVRFFPVILVVMDFPDVVLRVRRLIGIAIDLHEII